MPLLFHSTTDEKGSPQITTLSEPRAASDFMSTAAIADSPTVEPPHSHRNPPPFPRHAARFTGPTIQNRCGAVADAYPSAFCPIPPSVHAHLNTTPERLYAALSATDKEGQTDIQPERLHNHS